MKHKKLVGILATSTLLLGSVAMFAACGGEEHTIERVNETQATCTTGGHGVYYRCTDDGCGKLFADPEGKQEIQLSEVDTTAPLGHNMTPVEAKEASCTEDGAKAHYHCERCGNNYQDEAGTTLEEDAVIEKLGHDMKPVDKVIPETGKPGVKAHYYCEREKVEYFDSFGDKKVTNENKHELEYNMLQTAPSGWYGPQHDFSHSNDADPYVTITGENGLNAATTEEYTDLAYTVRIRKADAGREFAVLFFEDHSIYSVSLNEGKIKCDDGMNGWAYGSDNGYSYVNDEWEYALTQGELDCYEGYGLELTLARTGKTVKVLVNGQEVHSATLADVYATKTVKGGMIVWDAAPQTEYHFRVETKATTPEAPVVNLAPVTAAQGSVTYTQGTLSYGDELVITVTPTEDYVFDSLLVNGRKITQLTNGTYTTTATNIVNISVVFKAKEYGSLNASVTGKKHGVTDNAIAENAAYELVGKNKTYEGTLSNGKIVESKVLTGEYTLKIAGYLDQTITIEKDAAYTTALALEYDMFSLLHTDNGSEGYWNLVNTFGDFTHQNDTNVLNVLNGSDGMWVAYTNDKYDDLYFSATFKEGQSWDNRKAIQLAFDNGTGIQFGLKQDGVGISFGYWYSDRYLLNRGEEARLAPEEKIGNLSAEQLTKFNGNGITVSVVRTGNKIMLLVDGNIVRVLELSADYATRKCTPAIIIEWAGEQEIGVSVSTALPAFDTPTLSLTQGQNGTVTVTSGDTYSVWEKITLTITPNSNYRLKQLTVNGVAVTGNKTEYSFFPKAGENTVVAEFEQIPYGSVEASVVGKKHGVTGNAIADGAKVTLIGADNVKYENLIVAGGKINVADVVAGTYAVKLAGYLDGTITVLEGAEYTTDIVLEYNALSALENMWYSVNDLHLENMNDATAPTFSFVYNGGQVVTGNSYDELLFSIQAKKNTVSTKYRMYILFEDNKYVLTTLDMRGEGNNTVHFELCSWIEEWEFQNGGRGNLLNNIWTGYDFNATEKTAYEGDDGIMISLYRTGANIYALVGEKIVFMHTLDNAYATKKCRAGAFILDAAANSPYRFNIDDNPTVDLSATVTVGAGIENGTVTPSKMTAVYGEEITLTVTPAEGYRVKSITVNGNVLQAQSGVYKFNAATVNEISAEFELIPYGSLNADLTGKKHGVTGNAIANGTEVKLVGPKEYTVTVTGGKINLATLEAGTYAVKLAGYLDGTITVEKDNSYETAITLEYDMFTTNGWYDACQDFTHQNDENAYVSLTKEDGVNFVTKNGYDQVAITVTIGKDFYKHERAGVLMKFGDSMVWFTVKQADGAPVGFEWYGMPHGWGGNAVVPNTWGFDGAAFTDDDTESWNNGTMKLTLVRDGKTFYAFVNGTYRATLTADDAYASQKTQAGVRVEGSKTEGDKWFVLVEENITEYLNKLPSTTD